MTDPSRQEVQWCITCGARFTKEDVEGASCCPKCASSGVPCATEKDFLLAINWHELRVLCIWASNYAEKLDNDAKLCLRGIIFRLEHQAPNETPLTLGGEVRDAQAF